MKKKYLWWTLVCLLALLAGWTAWENTHLEQNTYVISSAHLPPAFSGFRIAHVSDLHNAQMGERNEKLLSMLEEMQPDMIAMTGDLIDSRKTDMGVALEFVSEAVKIAPCYYVPGNHEARIAQYGKFKEDLAAAGVTVLENAQTQISRGNDTITVTGVKDPSFETDYLLGDAEAVMNAWLEGFAVAEDTYRILLSHRPELFACYTAHAVDLALSGHAHGGQFRLPLIGGLFAPNQGLFPQYDAGVFTEDRTHMVVSRGIGNSAFPFRFANPPEVLLIELKTDL